jgi:methyl-accepting chemotaxis protein
VVADEVRNLSLRSSDAAKNTNELITDSVNRVATGVKLVGELDNCFQRIEAGAETVSGLIERISVATDEQSKGAAHVGEAVDSVNQVAERNAQEAQHTTMASKELSEAASSLNSAINHLSHIIQGGKF